MTLNIHEFTLGGKRESAEEEVAKHGSHNQKTHAGSKGGGVGGGDLAVGDTLEGVKDSRGIKVTVTEGKYEGKPAIVRGSNPDGSHTVDVGLGVGRVEVATVSGKGLKVREGNFASDLQGKK
jgi:hypothetical protein